VVDEERTGRRKIALLYVRKWVVEKFVGVRRSGKDLRRGLVMGMGVGVSGVMRRACSGTRRSYVLQGLDVTEKLGGQGGHRWGSLGAGGAPVPQRWGHQRPRPNSLTAAPVRRGPYFAGADFDEEACT
jgi:hypothetical protein